MEPRFDGSVPEDLIREHWDGLTPELSGVTPDSRPHCPGYVNFGSPSEDVLADLEGRLKLGQLPQFGRIHIL
jgi:hypothetical protein